VIISRVNTLLQNINGVVLQLRDAFRGTEATVLGRAVSGLEGTIRDASSLVGNVDAGLRQPLDDAGQITESIGRIAAQTESALADLKVLTAELANPDSLALRLLDVEGPVYVSLEQSLKSIAGIMEGLEMTAGALPAQMSQAAALIPEIRSALEAAEDVIIALRNNPLLKNGVPDRTPAGTGGASPRDISF
jgi:phospholipid/cholesterol/gamma-HCH transport system substrate-binding protein